MSHYCTQLVSRTLSLREIDYLLTFLGRNYTSCENTVGLLYEQLRLAVRGYGLVVFVHKYEVHVDLAATLNPGNLGVAFQEPELLSGISFSFIVFEHFLGNRRDVIAVHPSLIA